ncbi:hypothetical protein AA106555_2025 [Neokomagataea thailandica NBRC 106555]|uniref:Uncharacterized protein n=2 Tax=Neokomagataea TaxID=1223423 RepID=A0A4Y6V747_9PROT|nr:MULTISPECIES: hypothetical protein [Neokomagataea]QDH24490.1 hypothetical protein D5366_03675 [Neokomagataea tanensis]GBR55470.1 hypothetical protein AA106555_2025 [Neokomagataea thailandica NBRC 106555]
MLGSTIIENNGVFLGVAILISQTGLRRFYAAHESVRSLHNETVHDLAALQARVLPLARKAVV